MAVIETLISARQALEKENAELKAYIAYLVSEFGEANSSWTRAAIKIPFEALTLGETPSVLVAMDVITLETVISVSLPQAKPSEEGEVQKAIRDLEKLESERIAKQEASEAKSRQIIESQTNGVCRNCGKEIYKARAWTSLWFHKEHGRSECDLGSGTWARPRKKF